MASRKSGDEQHRTLHAAAGTPGTSPGGSTPRRVPITDDLDEGRVSMGPESASPASAAGAPGSATPASGESRIIGGRDSWSNADGPGPQVMSADSLEGNEVVNLAGEGLGKIQDIMIDVQRGRIAYAVLSFGGFLGMGDKLFAVPWETLKLDADNECFVMDVDKERLQNAPGFDKDNWPSMADMQWARGVHSHYGTRPYWE